jgi:predicted nucleotidyltransferase
MRCQPRLRPRSARHLPLHRRLPRLRTRPRDSDTDLRGIYLAPAELQWSLFGAPEQFEDNATQSCYWELQKFLVMALKANPNILECLYSPLVDKVTPIGERTPRHPRQASCPR